jgi:hypothetical protein
LRAIRRYGAINVEEPKEPKEPKDIPAAGWLILAVWVTGYGIAAAKGFSVIIGAL